MPDRQLGFCAMSADRWSSKTGFQGRLRARINPHLIRRETRPARDASELDVKDISYIAAFPKSGITYLNFMLFHILFDCPQDARLIDSDYIFDFHESLARVPPVSDEPRCLKIHF